MRRFAPALVLLFSLALPHVAVAQTAIGPGQETADLNDYIAKHEDDKGLGAAVAQAMQRLGRLEEEQKHEAAAAALWKKARHWFAKHHYAANGGPEAQVAAEATRRLLVPQFVVAADLRVRTTPQLAPEAAIAERTAELDSFLTFFIGKRPNPSPDAVRAGGLLAELDQVRSYGALAESRAAANAIAELAQHAAEQLAQLPIPEGLDAAQQTAQQAAVKLAIGELEGRAFTAIEAVWLAKPDTKDPGAMALRKHLTRLRPLRYPQLEESATDMVAVTDAQAKASKFATLGQASKDLSLRIRYFQQAVKLDPQNAQYLLLLQAAQKEAGQTP